MEYVTVALNNHGRNTSHCLCSKRDTCFSEAIVHVTVNYYRLLAPEATLAVVYPSAPRVEGFMKALNREIDLAAGQPQTCTIKRTFLFTMALAILGACSTISDSEFTHAFCERQGIGSGSAHF